MTKCDEVWEEITGPAGLRLEIQGVVGPAQDKVSSPHGETALRSKNPVLVPMKVGVTRRRKVWLTHSLGTSCIKSPVFFIPMKLNTALIVNQFILLSYGITG